jgi:hypothetical protein
LAVKILLHLTTKPDIMQKAALSTMFLLSCAITLLAQTTTTFKVEKLSSPKIKVFPTMSYDSIWQTLIAVDKAGIHNDYRQLPPIQGNIVAKSKVEGRLVSRQGHAFFDGIYTAYADHHPITLSPDMIWLLISQGFAHHVYHNAKDLRNLIVDFEGKKELTVESKTISLNNPDSPWEEAFTGFDRQIRANTQHGVAELLTSGFSTTTVVSKVASQITLMNAVQPYFDYKLMFSGCGIPEVTLEGSPADWQSVLTRAQALRKYKLDWWIDKLEPVLKQFVSAAKGKANKAFWRNMVKQRSISFKGGCGGGKNKADVIDGWIVKLFPYNKHGDRYSLKTIGTSGMRAALPEEVLKVDLKYVDASVPEHETTTPLELYAGFVGLEQNPANYGLKPVIGWMIRKKDAAVK